MFKRMSDGYFDVHKWLHDVEVEHFWEIVFLSGATEATEKNHISQH